MKSILIGAQVDSLNICTFEKKLKMNEKQECYGLIKIQVNLNFGYDLRKIFT